MHVKLPYTCTSSVSTAKLSCPTTLANAATSHCTNQLTTAGADSILDRLRHTTFMVGFFFAFFFFFFLLSPFFHADILMTSFTNGTLPLIVRTTTARSTLVCAATRAW
jgi:hypothetical protein